MRYGKPIAFFTLLLAIVFVANGGQTWQTFNENAGGDTVKVALTRLRDRTDTLQSTWSGTTAPASPVVGMLWWDSDDFKLYICKSLGPTVWQEVPNGTPVAITSGGTGATTASGARTGLGLGTAATLNSGTGTGDLPTTALADARYTQRANNLSDLNSASVSRTNLGLGALATLSAVGTAQISDVNVTTGKVADLAITTGKVADLAITTGKLGPGAVTTGKISGTANRIFGTDGSGVGKEYLLSEVTPSFPGRKLSALQSGTNNPNVVAVLTANNEIWHLGRTAYASPDLSNGRSHNLKWRRLFFQTEPGTLTKVVISGRSGYALDNTGKVWSWGANSVGQLGHGNTTTLTTAKRIEYFVSNSITVSDVVVCQTNHGTTGYENAWFRSSTGTVYGCGSNASGQLGDGTTTQRTTPVPCGTVTGITQLTASEAGDGAHVVALKSDGVPYVWGRNNFGNLGQGNTTNLTTPTAISGQTGVTYVTAIGAQGGLFTAIAIGSTLRMCGANSNGQLGDASTTQRNSLVTPTLPGSPGNISQVVGTGLFGSSFVLDASGKLYVCGDNANGQLGTGNTTDQSSFTAVTLPGGVTATKIAFGSNHFDGAAFYFLGSDGELYASGRNSVGELGTGNTTQATSFAKMIRAKSTSTETIADFVVVGNAADNTPTSTAVFARTTEGQLLGCGRIQGTGIGLEEDRPEYVLMPVPIQ